MEKIMRLVPPSWDLEPLVAELESVEAIVNTICIVQPGDLDPSHIPTLMNVISDKVLSVTERLKDLNPYVNERTQKQYVQNKKEQACLDS